MNRVKIIFKLLLLAGSAIVLMFLIKMTIPSEKQVAQLFESKMSTPTPLQPTSTPKKAPTPESTVTPTPTIPPAMATKAAIVSKAKGLTPNPPKYYPVRSEKDIISVVFKDENFIQLTTQRLNKATADTPIKVKWLGEDYEGAYYYLIPFRRDDHIIGIAQIWVNNGKARMGMWSDADIDQFPLVSAQEAVRIVRGKGLKIIRNPELVYLPILETGSDWTNPQWRILTDQGYVYIIWSSGEPKFLFEDELHPISEE